MGNGSAAVSRSALGGSSVSQLQRGVERAFLWLRPDGGQGRARRNAWSAMVADSQRRQSRMFVAREIGPAVVPAVPAGSVPHPARGGSQAQAARAR
jgi:hypothetical protein